MSKLSGNPFVSHGRTQDTMTMTMTYDILAIIGVNKVGGVSLPPPSFYFSLRTGSLEEDWANIFHQFQSSMLWEMRK